MKKMLLAVLVAVSFISANAIAHGGRTDANGCHEDTRTGTVHCH